MTLRVRDLALLLGLSLALGAGCGAADKAAPKQRVELAFVARVGDADFACGQSYMLGTPATAVQGNDLRLYVYDVALVRADGSKVAVQLDTDGKWQAQGVALLDFEDGSSSCSGGTPERNLKLVGSVEDHGDYTGLHFRIGVPSELNHLDSAKQPAPLNVPAMFWSWQDGHIFLASEWKTPINFGWQFRVSESTYESDDGCKGSHSSGYHCPNSFQPIVDLAVFDAGKDTVKLDLGRLFAQIDFTRTDFAPLTQLPSADAAANGSLDYQPGCHTDEWDAECIPLYSVLGVDYLHRGLPDASKQTFASKL
ncbi:MAG: hypothetical protein JWN48_4419 [Myxococcaceae bacterium]|nr:hypothetical protein [Myxococcaceae bacterium]